MTGAIALAVVLVIAVAGISMAMQGQRTGPGAPTRPRPVQPNRPTMNPRRTREKSKTPPPPPPADMPPPMPEPEVRGPELLRTGVPAEATVISVVDERTIGPVTRSRLTLRVEPQEGDPWEVTTRFAFPTPAARAQVKVGGRVPVKYDKDDHSRIVVDLPAE